MKTLEGKVKISTGNLRLAQDKAKPLEIKIQRGSINLGGGDTGLHLKATGKIAEHPLQLSLRTNRKRTSNPTARAVAGEAARLPMK